MLLVNNVREKNITESQNKQNFESVGMLSVICLCYNFALVLQETHKRHIIFPRTLSGTVNETNYIP